MWEDDDAEMIGSVGGAESGSVYDEDVLFVEEVEDEFFVCFPCSLLHGIDSWEDVEGAVWFGSGDALYFVESFVGEVSSLFEFFIHFFDVVLWSGEGVDAGLLADGVCAES